jgi:bifunctional non-homologous end joining protein LigD
VFFKCLGKVMTLKKYREKRDFKETEEPSGRAPRSTKEEPLHFCVQKHAARRLHYDFRLECRGILLSWAIPKGPSLDPSDKRLAIHVEDHPLDYQYFEGTIPKGNYGAGKVEIWDAGVYGIIGATSRKDAEKMISAGMKKGHLTFVMNGEKLKGSFSLQKIDEEKDQWILIKLRDEYVKMSI